MRLFDTSHYCDDEKIENYIIEVLPVNKSTWLSFNVAKHFSLVLNSSNLRYKRVAESEGLVALTDGIYEIKQSIKPNLFTVVHFYHFRVTDLENKLRVQMLKLIENECKLSRQEYVLQRDRLRELDEFLKSAKWAVEECGDKTKGKDLYEFTKKLLENYTNDCACGTKM